MEKFENLDTQKRTLYKTGFTSGDYNQNLYLKKSVDDGSNRLKIFLSVYSKINNELVQQGYIYFYLDSEYMTSDFIGIKVEPQFRNLNIASFLVASWIDLCLNNGYEFLGTHEKQRKPFLLYLLKTYGFEIFDVSLYEARSDVISILRSTDYMDKRKFLLFKDSSHERIFRSTHICKADNYVIAPDVKNLIYLDSVILPLQSRKRNQLKYELWNHYLAECKVEEVINRHKR